MSIVTPLPLVQSKRQPVMFASVQCTLLDMSNCRVRQVLSLTRAPVTEYPPRAPCPLVKKKISAMPAVPAVTRYRIVMYLFVTGLNDPRPLMKRFGSAVVEVKFRMPELTELTVV